MIIQELAILQDSEDTAGECRAHGNLGAVHMSLGNNTLALRWSTVKWWWSWWWNSTSGGGSDVKQFHSQVLSRAARPRPGAEGLAGGVAGPRQHGDHQDEPHPLWGGHRQLWAAAGLPGEGGSETRVKGKSEGLWEPGRLLRLPRRSSGGRQIPRAVSPAVPSGHCSIKNWASVCSTRSDCGKNTVRWTNGSGRGSEGAGESLPRTWSDAEKAGESSRSSGLFNFIMMVIKWIGRTQDDVGDEHLDGDDGDGDDGGDDGDEQWDGAMRPGGDVEWWPIGHRNSAQCTVTQFSNSECYHLCASVGQSSAQCCAKWMLSVEWRGWIDVNADNL